MPAKVIAWKCLLLCVLSNFFASAQKINTGIFLVTGKDNPCENVALNIGKTVKICITPEPIISIQDFNSVTLINKLDPVGHVCNFNLVLSPAGFDKIKKLYSKLPHASLILVVDGTGVGYIKNLDSFHNKSLKIDGNLKDLTMIREKFEQALSKL
jgi:hypothetical protein